MGGAVRHGFHQRLSHEKKPQSLLGLGEGAVDDGTRLAGEFDACAFGAGMEAIDVKPENPYTAPEAGKNTQCSAEYVSGMMLRSATPNTGCWRVSRYCPEAIIPVMLRQLCTAWLLTVGRLAGYPSGIQTRQSGRERYSCYTSFARLAVRARLDGGSRSLGLDEFSSGN